jgi:hypothetical protein
MRCAPAPLTDEQLALAYRQLRRPHWPQPLAVALAHPVYGPAIKGVARNLSRAAMVSAQRAPVLLAGATVPPTPGTRPAAARAASPGPDALGAWPRPGRPGLPFIDHKRLAANDKDDE